MSKWRVRKVKGATNRPVWIAGDNARFQSFNTWREAFEYAVRQGRK